MKKKKLEKIIIALHKIKNGERNSNNGICNNLYFMVDCTNEIEEFLSSVFSSKYGNPDITYPIEGDRLIHQSDSCKWDLSTTFGKKRAELLDYMIDYSKEWMKQYE